MSVEERTLVRQLRSMLRGKLVELQSGSQLKVQKMDCKCQAGKDAKLSKPMDLRPAK